MSSRYIVIHKNRRRLELYEGNRLLQSSPVAVGKANTPTPVGHFKIANKRLNPGGVYGSRWLGLSAAGYGIHGTNNPASIGQAVSKGCIRLHNRDVENLFTQVDIGTPVIVSP